jgi:N-acetylglucosamine-6-phosphate deacetylase
LITAARKRNSTVAWGITGIHVEGPYISRHDGPRGAHDIRFVRAADTHELDQWIDASEGLVKIITIAPEVENAIEFIKYATRQNIVCAIGHTAASDEQIDAAIKAGARLSTHLGNGTAKMVDRLNNHIWAQLAHDELTTSIIADMIHVPPVALKVMLRCKGASRIILISDMAPVAGLPPGKTVWGKLPVEVCENGAVRLSGTPYLAGASSPLLRNLDHVVNTFGVPLSDAAKMCTVNPTRLCGLDISRMELQEGAYADFFLFEKSPQGFSHVIQI